MHNSADKKDTAEISDDSISEDMLEQAATWLARRRDTDLDSRAARTIEADFKAWLLANPLHRQAYADMESLWGALARPVAQVMAEPSLNHTHPRQAALHRGPNWSFLPGLATAACLVLALGTGIGWQQDWITQWQSDYRTAVGERVPVELEDNSRVTLNTHSAMAVDYTGGERRVRLLKGEAWFEVAADPSRPFIVETGPGTVKVTGTRFNVRLEKGAAIVSLDEGRVQLDGGDSPGQASLVLARGHQAQLTETGITAPEHFDHSAVTAWLRGQFVFYNTPLGEVVATLNRHRHGRILISGDKLNTLKVSGVFSTHDPDAALTVITNTLPVTQTRLTDYLVLLR
ncbi:MAG: FecR family protein [Cellvibrionaceae bacterium]